MPNSLLKRPHVSQQRQRRLFFEPLEDRLALCAEDIAESNDTPAQASAQPAGGTDSANFGTISGAVSRSNLCGLNADWYRISTSDYGTSHTTARIDFTHAQGNLDLELYDSTGTTRLALSNGSNTSRNFETVDLATRAPGDYFLRVVPQGTTIDPAYSLAIVSPGSLADDAYEANDTPTAVTALPEGGVNSANLGLITSTTTIAGLKLEDQADWYRVVTNDYGTSHDTVRIDFTNTNGNLNLELYAANGTTLLQSSGSFSANFEQVSFATTAPGTYFVRVYGNGGDANSSYSLTIDPPGNSPDDAYDPNDTPTAVAALPEGGVNSANLGLITSTTTIAGLKLEDQADWYRVVTNDYGTSHDTVRIDFTNTNGNLNLELYAANGTTRLQSSSSFSGNSEQVSFATTAPGTYFIRVYGNSGDANSSYTLTIDPPGNSPDDPYEINDTTSDVAAQMPGGLNSSNLGLVSGNKTIANLALEDQADWYRVELGDFPLSTNFVRINFTHSQGDLYLELYKADGTTRISSSNGSWTGQNFESISLNGLAGGVYWVKVTGASGAANASYQLVVDAPVIPAPQADLALLREQWFANSTTVAPLGTVSNSVAVVNTGNLASGSFRVAAYLSTDATVNTADRLLGSTTLTLAAGESRIVSLPLTIPADVTAGSYTIGWLADDQDLVPEPNQTNNLLTMPLVVSAAPPVLGQIRGQVFDDLNANGTKDTGEAVIAGRTVFLDFDQDRQVDPGEPSVVTDVAGNYTFTNVAPGSYRVEVAVPTGWRHTWPIPSEQQLAYVSDSSRIATVDLLTGEVNLLGAVSGLVDIAFGPDGQLYGMDWTGVLRINPITGQRTQVMSLFGSFNALTFDTDGLLYAASSGNSNLTLINIATGTSSTVGSMGISSDGDLAFYQGKLYLTASNNHLYEINKVTAVATDLGLFNYSPSSSNNAGLITSSTGELITFTNQIVSAIELNPLKMRFRYDLTGSGLGTITGAARMGEAGGPVNGGHVVTLAAGQTISNLAFGQVRLGAITGTVYDDLNLNGSRGTLEPQLEGWTVYADQNSDGRRQASEPAATTDSAGQYSLRDLLPGQYKLRVVVPQEWSAISPTNGQITTTLTASNLFPVISFGVARPDPPQVNAISPAPGAVIGTGVSQITVQFTNEMEAAALWTGSFPIQAAGGDGIFDNGNDRTFRGDDFRWDSATQTAVISFAKPLARDLYRVRVEDYLLDIYGNSLDGENLGRFPSGNSFEGGDFVSTFEVSNGVPTATGGQTTVLQGTPLTIALSGSDPDQQSVSFRIVTSPAHGTLVPGAAANEFIYTANSAYVGFDSFTFVASDGQAESQTATYSLRVMPTPADLAPVSLNWPVNASFQPGGSVTVSWTGINNGPGATADFSLSDWTDAIYLSYDPVWDLSDRWLSDAPLNIGSLAAGGSYSSQTLLTLPTNVLERPGDYYLILKVDNNRSQYEANESNNELAMPFRFTSGVQLTSPRSDSLAGALQSLNLQWIDFSADPNAMLSFAIDSDSDPSNGLGHTLLATNVSPIPEGAGDSLTVTLPAVTPGRYYIWGQMTDNTGVHYSTPIPIVMAEEAYRDISPENEPLGGSSYEVQNVEWGRIGDEIVYRVTTNYDPRTSGGGDLYINVGGNFESRTGNVVGIATKNRTTASGLPVSVGQLYVGAQFVDGTIRHEHPSFIQSYQRVVNGQSSLQVTTLPAGGPRYQISGSFFLSAIGSQPGASLQIGWGMYCGNDFGHAENIDILPDLQGAQFVRTVTTAAERNLDWGNLLTLDVQIQNVGTEPTVASTSAIYLSRDNVIDANDVFLGQFNVPALAGNGVFQTQRQVTLPATAPTGFATSGVFYVGMIADVGQTVVEASEANNRNRGDKLDQLSLRIGGTAEYVNVLTHGFNPFALDPTGLIYTEQEAHDLFIANWKKKFPDAINNLVAGTPLAGQVQNYHAEWDSTTGWREAALSVIAGLAVRFTPLPPIIKDRLSRFAFDQIPGYMHRASQLAESAAVKIVQDLLTQPDLLGPPSDNQIIHLIGHSRGAAVNARVSQILHDRYQYTVDQYTALDGYSTDWPNLTGVLGDIPIDANTVDATKLVNYRVQQSLFEPAGPYLDAVINSFFRYSVIGLIIPDDLGTQLLRAIDARAPIRTGFVNQMLLGTAASGPSNHMNISDLYFESVCRAEPSERYILNSTLAQAAIQAGSLATSNCIGVSSSAVTPPPPTGSSRNANSVQPNVGDLQNIFGGNFDDIGRNVLDIAAIPLTTSTNDPFLDQWLLMIRQPDFQLRNTWQVTGNVQVVANSSDSDVLLTQSAVNPSLGQWLVVANDAQQLQFSYGVDAAGPGDLLEVVFGDQVIGQWNLSTLGTSGVQTVSLTTLRGQSAPLTFRVAGPLTQAARVRLDDIAVLSPLSLTGLQVDPLSLGDVTVHVTALGATDASSVAFYRESNGIEGLQLGTNGDLLWTRDTLGSNGWTADLDLRPLSPGRYSLYAVALNNLGTAGNSNTTATINVSPQPTLTVSLAVTTISENGGQTTGTVTRTNTDITEPLTVTLTSSRPQDARVNTTVTILAGNSSATFPINGVDETIQDGHQTVLIGANSPFFTPAFAELTVYDNESIISWQNTPRTDVDNDKKFDILDILAWVYYMDKHGLNTPIPNELPVLYVDVNNDRTFDIFDILQLVYYFNQLSSPEGESEFLNLGASKSKSHESVTLPNHERKENPMQAADLYFATWGDADE